MAFPTNKPCLFKLNGNFVMNLKIQVDKTLDFVEAIFLG